MLLKHCLLGIICALAQARGRVGTDDCFLNGVMSGRDTAENEKGKTQKTKKGDIRVQVTRTNQVH